MMNCPNCSSEFVENVGEKYRCADCGWLTKENGEWKPVEAPQAEPQPQPEIKPVEKQPEQQPNIKKYFGGLVTVTEVEGGE